MIIPEKGAFKMLSHDEIQTAVTNHAERYDIKNAYYFGSYASGTQTEESDLDLLVEFGPQAPDGWGGPAVGLSCDLEDALGVSVDVINLPLTRDSILILESVVKCYGSKPNKAACHENA
jgi:predicted nucleotidyltransferase